MVILVWISVFLEIVSLELIAVVCGEVEVVFFLEFFA